MTEISDINLIETILDNSVAVAMLIYFIWKQERYDKKTLETLQAVKDKLNQIHIKLDWNRPVKETTDPFK